MIRDPSHSWSLHWRNLWLIICWSSYTILAFILLKFRIGLSHPRYWRHFVFKLYLIYLILFCIEFTSRDNRMIFRKIGRHNQFVWHYNNGSTIKLILFIPLTLNKSTFNFLKSLKCPSFYFFCWGERHNKLFFSEGLCKCFYECLITLEMLCDDST